MDYEQLSLDLVEDSSIEFDVEVIVNGEALESRYGGPYKDALLLRAFIVHTSFPHVTWENHPRSTGWYGHRLSKSGVTDHYLIRVKKVPVKPV